MVVLIFQYAIKKTQQCACGLSLLYFPDRCVGIECKFEAVCDEGRCVCPQCPSTAAPVCGSDEQTYLNQCELRRQSCSITRDISVTHHGECDDDMFEEESGSGGKLTEGFHILTRI